MEVPTTPPPKIKARMFCTSGADRLSRFRAVHLDLPAGGGQRKRLDGSSYADLVDRLEQDEQIGLVDHDPLVLLPQFDLLLLVRLGSRTMKQLHHIVRR